MYLVLSVPCIICTLHCMYLVLSVPRVLPPRVSCISHSHSGHDQSGHTAVDIWYSALCHISIYGTVLCAIYRLYFAAKLHHLLHPSFHSVYEQTEYICRDCGKGWHYTMTDIWLLPLRPISDSILSLTRVQSVLCVNAVRFVSC